VADGLEEIKQRLTSLELPVDDVVLLDRFQIYVSLNVARRPSTPAVDAQGAPLFIGGGQWIMSVPILGAAKEEQAMVAHFDCTDFDSQAPTAELMDSARNVLPGGQWPRDLKDGGIVFGHPDFNRPFFCRPLLREYHSHPQHADDPWDSHREGTTLAGIVLSLLGSLNERWIL
jgi:hypothetical protein